MSPTSKSVVGLACGCAALICLTAAPGRAEPPVYPWARWADAPVPGLFVGSDSRSYPYYSGFRWYPAYPLYRAYPEYQGYPLYPRFSYAAGAQPSHPYLLAFFGLHPALWSFPDYYSGNYPSYYGATPDYRGGPADSPPPLAAPAAAGPPSPVDGDAPCLPPPPSPTPSRASAVVTVEAPADAEVWFDGRKTTATGAFRRFHTPPLLPGSRYTYDVTARWVEDGRPMTQRQSVFVTAGTAAAVSFVPEALGAVGSK